MLFRRSSAPSADEGSELKANEVLNVPLTAVNTFVLIISSTTVVLACRPS